MNLSKPILAVIALGAFNAAYSNFMFAFILCQDREMWTMMVWLYQLQQFSGQGVVFASLIVAAIPTRLVFFTTEEPLKGVCLIEQPLWVATRTGRRATDCLKRRVCKCTGHNESGPLFKPRYAVPCGQGFR